MSVRIQEGSVLLQVIRDPRALESLDQGRDDETGDRLVRLLITPFTVLGRLILVGSRNDDLGGWMLGWIQVVKEVNYGIYQGRGRSDGSMRVLQAGQSARHPSRVCRDTLTQGAILVEGPGASFRVSQWNIASGLVMQCVLNDNPIEAKPPQAMVTYRAEMVNPATRQPNFLREVKTALDFCSVLTLKDPLGNFRHLKHIFWQVHWHMGFGFPDTDGNPVLDQTSLETFSTPEENGVGSNPIVHDGAPTDPVFARLLTSPRIPNCLVVSSKGFKEPVILSSKLTQNHKPTRNWH